MNDGTPAKAPSHGRLNLLTRGLEQGRGDRVEQRVHPLCTRDGGVDGLARLDLTGPDEPGDLDGVGCAEDVVTHRRHGIRFVHTVSSHT